MQRDFRLDSRWLGRPPACYSIQGLTDLTKQCIEPDYFKRPTARVIYDKVDNLLNGLDPAKIRDLPGYVVGRGKPDEIFDDANRAKFAVGQPVPQPESRVPGSLTLFREGALS